MYTPSRAVLKSRAAGQAAKEADRSTIEEMNKTAADLKSLGWSDRAINGIINSKKATASALKVPNEARIATILKNYGYSAEDVANMTSSVINLAKVTPKLPADLTKRIAQEQFKGLGYSGGEDLEFYYFREGSNKEKLLQRAYAGDQSAIEEIKETMATPEVAKQLKEIRQGAIAPKSVSSAATGVSPTTTTPAFTSKYSDSDLNGIVSFYNTAAKSTILGSMISPANFTEADKNNQIAIALQLQKKKGIDYQQATRIAGNYISYNYEGKPDIVGSANVTGQNKGVSAAKVNAASFAARQIAPPVSQSGFGGSEFRSPTTQIVYTPSGAGGTKTGGGTKTVSGVRSSGGGSGAITSQSYIPISSTSSNARQSAARVAQNALNRANYAYAKSRATFKR
jgi:hypothetical protein